MHLQEEIKGISLLNGNWLKHIIQHQSHSFLRLAILIQIEVLLIYLHQLFVHVDFLLISIEQLLIVLIKLLNRF